MIYPMSLDDMLRVYVEATFETPRENIYHFTNSLEAIKRSTHIKLSLNQDLSKKGHQELVASKHLIMKKMSRIKALKELIPRFKEYIRDGIQVYTLSCCEGNKNNQLTRYGKESLVLLKELIPQYLDENQLLLVKVVYDPRKQKRIIDKIFNLYKKATNNNKQTDLFLWLSIIMPLFKTVRFRSENECRFISIQILSRGTQELATRESLKQIPLNGWN